MVPQGPAPAARPPLPVGPSLEAWQAMSPEARDVFLVQVLDALTDPASAMTEGRPHKEAKTRAVDQLGLHFRTMGRALYLAEELAVVYPNEPVFSPDILAVLDVVQPERDERLAWVVADEGRGPDFVLEVLHRGDRKKDLVDNVQRYDRLSIPEYFVYDRARQQILGHRLAGGDRYERLVPQGGRTPSGVLGIDFSVRDGVLCLFQGAAELYGTTDLVGQLTGIVSSLETKANETEARLDRLEAEAAEATTRAGEATSQLRAGILAALEARGIPVSLEHRARVASCGDAAVLGGWLLRALSAIRVDEVLGGATPER